MTPRVAFLVDSSYGHWSEDTDGFPSLVHSDGPYTLAIGQLSLLHRGAGPRETQRDDFFFYPARVRNAGPSICCAVGPWSCPSSGRWGACSSRKWSSTHLSSSLGILVIAKKRWRGSHKKKEKTKCKKKGKIKSVFLTNTRLHTRTRYSLTQNVGHVFGKLLPMPQIIRLFGKQGYQNVLYLGTNAVLIRQLDN
jgi:hypothetical protein